MGTPDSVTRSIDVSGTEIKTFLDSDGNHIQAIALVDAEGNHSYFTSVQEGDEIILDSEDGIKTNFVPSSGMDFDNLVRAIRTTQDGSLSVQNNAMNASLQLILLEMKKMNLYLAEITDIEIDNEDIE